MIVRLQVARRLEGEYGIWAAVWNRACVTVDEPAPGRSVYRVKRAYYARALGRSAIVTAVVVLLATVCLQLGAPGFLNAVLVVLSVTDWLGPATLLTLTFLLGCGIVLARLFRSLSAKRVGRAWFADEIFCAGCGLRD